MKEIIQALKKNYKEFCVFLFCVALGILIAFYSSVFYLQHFQKKINYLSECTNLVSSMMNYKQKDKTFGYTAQAYNVYPPKNYNYRYPANLDCVFTQAEKDSGVADIYTLNMADFTKTTADFNKTNDLQLFLEDLESLTPSDDFNFGSYKTKLAVILGEPLTKNLKTKNDLLLTAFSEQLKAEDQDHTNYQSLQDKISSPDFKKKLDKLEQDTSKNNPQQDNLDLSYILLVSGLLVLFLYLISLLKFVSKYKNIPIFILSGGVVYMIYIAVVFISQYL